MLYCLLLQNAIKLENSCKIIEMRGVDVVVRCISQLRTTKCIVLRLK